jgi:hypothetical protein
VTKQPARQSRLIPGLLFLFLLLFPLPFLPEYGGANSTTRIMLTTAIVDEGTTRIDRHQALTVDKAERDGHYHSDKAPGMALLAVPVYALASWLDPEADGQLDILSPLASKTEPGLQELIVYRLMVLTSGGLLFAFAGVAVFAMCLGLGGQAPAALLATATVFLGTPMLGWSVQFFGHAAAGAALASAFALAFLIRPGGTNNPVLALLSGLALSLAVSIEYTAAPPVLLIACYGIWRLTRLRRDEALRLLSLAVLAAVTGALPMLVYHAVSFGSPFSVGYSSVVGFQGMQQGLLGITLPDPVVLLRIIFGFQRGILWLSPVLLLVPIGFWLAWRQRRWIPELLLSLSIVLYYFLLNAAYFYWNGGASVGPRHVTPALPFMVVPLLWLWLEAGGRLRLALIGLVGLSLFFSLVTASTRMTVSTGYRFPLKDPILENYFAAQNAFNRWWEAGLHPAAILPIWLGVLALLVWSLWRVTAREGWA